MIFAEARIELIEVLSSVLCRDMCRHVSREGNRIDEFALAKTG
jgi:hypothetical protein